MKSEAFEFGYVARAHGLKGELIVRLHDPLSTVLDDVRRLCARDKGGREVEHRISRARRGAPGEYLVFLEGIDTRAAAEALRGSTLLAFRVDLPPCSSGEYFQGDIVGLEARTPEGVVLGRVEGLFEGGGVPNLVISGGPSGELMVPFVDEFVLEIDLEARVVVVRLPEYLS